MRSGYARHGFDVLARRLAEADPGIEDDNVLGNAGFRGERKRTIEEAPHVRKNIGSLVLLRPIVHDDDGRLRLGNRVRHARVLLQAPNVIDDGRADLDRSHRNRGLAGIDGDRHVEKARQRRQDLLDAREVPPPRTPVTRTVASILLQYRQCRIQQRPCSWHERWRHRDSEIGRRRRKSPGSDSEFPSRPDGISALLRKASRLARASARIRSSPWCRRTRTASARRPISGAR